MMLAVLVVAAGVLIGPAPANAEKMNGTTSSAEAAASWDCGGYWDSNQEFWVVECNRGSDGFEVYFDPHGEHLYVSDGFPNGHHTYAYLDIENTPELDYTRHHGRFHARDFNLSIAEGTRVSLRACSSNRSTAKCTPAIHARA
jgi:hypothetical protein